MFFLSFFGSFQRQNSNFQKIIFMKRFLLLAISMCSFFAQAQKTLLYCGQLIDVKGVKIAFGTDAGVFAHGNNWLEFKYMTESGMPILEAIKSATVNAADLLGASAQLGSIEQGKLADIIAVDGDPRQSVDAMGKVKFVMKDGNIYK